MTSAITISNLDHYFYDGKNACQVLRDISLQVKFNELVILSGPSGCGKTTLLSIIAGLRPVQKGSLVVAGDQLNTRSLLTINKVRSKIGLIFQTHQLLGFLNARENVQLALDIPSLSHITPVQKYKTAVELLAEIGLADKTENMITQLSGGQRQRVAIARALASQPEVILADEPTASLDTTNGRHIMELMQNIAKNRRTAILMTSHDQRLYHFADRIIKIDDGSIVD